jgi:hypothetical protein
MQARTIVTSHPDVACDVCERRLLRGEHPDVFIVAGDRRLVCELCAPRAVHEGWQRESDRGPYELAPPKPRRGRGILERLLGTPRASSRAEPEVETEPDPYELLGDERLAPADTLAAPPHDEQLAPAPHSPLEVALDAFNASEYPRRVAGVARSLGPPRVTVRTAEHADAVIVIVVAWELSWYRYQVDLDELEPAAHATGQGTELEELAREDLSDNAQALESGALRLQQAA